jgi:hypothetical protein
VAEDKTPILRRKFLGRLATKAAYVAPAIVVLHGARHAHAGSGACLIQGSPCETDVNGCCTGLTCQRANGNPCVNMGMTAAMCTCEP